MSGGMYLAAAGALVQQVRLEIIANNVANIDTIGYKAEKSVFSVNENPSTPNPLETTGVIQPLSPYAPPFHTVIDFSQGAIRQTGNPLDVAINGKGFFAVQTPDGVQYTRQGRFTLDAAGTLVTPEGFAVLGEGGQITLEQGDVEIHGEGGVYVDGDEVGRLRITDFGNGDALKKAGGGRFVAPNVVAPEERPLNTTLSQGYLETANVNPVQAMTEMIETARAFEAYQKVIHSADEATSKSINDVGKTI